MARRALRKRRPRTRSAQRRRKSPRFFFFEREGARWRALFRRVSAFRRRVARADICSGSLSLSLSLSLSTFDRLGYSDDGGCSLKRRGGVRRACVRDQRLVNPRPFHDPNWEFSTDACLSLSLENIAPLSRAFRREPIRTLDSVPDSRVTNTSASRPPRGLRGRVLTTFLKIQRKCQLDFQRDFQRTRPRDEVDAVDDEHAIPERHVACLKKERKMYFSNSTKRREKKDFKRKKKEKKREGEKKRRSLRKLRYCTGSVAIATACCGNRWKV